LCYSDAEVENDASDVRFVGLGGRSGDVGSVGRKIYKNGWRGGKEVVIDSHNNYLLRNNPTQQTTIINMGAFDEPATYHSGENNSTTGRVSLLYFLSSVISSDSPSRNPSRTPRETSSTPETLMLLEPAFPELSALALVVLQLEAWPDRTPTDSPTAWTDEDPLPLPLPHLRRKLTVFDERSWTGPRRTRSLLARRSRRLSVWEALVLVLPELTASTRPPKVRDWARELLVWLVFTRVLRTDFQACTVTEMLTTRVFRLVSSFLLFDWVIANLFRS
jgi:hypothetical protein